MVSTHWTSRENNARTVTKPLINQASHSLIWLPSVWSFTAHCWTDRLVTTVKRNITCGVVSWSHLGDFLHSQDSNTAQCVFVYCCEALMALAAASPWWTNGDQLTAPQWFYWSKVGKAQRWRCRIFFGALLFLPMGKKNPDFLPLWLGDA